MSLRPPAIPGVGLMAFVLLLLALIAAGATGMWISADQPGTAAFHHLVWTALTVLAYWASLLAVPLLRALRVTDPTARWPMWSRWALFYGAFIAATGLGCWQRVWLADLLIGPSAPSHDNMLLYIGPIPWVLNLLFVIERQAAFRDACAAEKVRIERAVEALFLSRESLLRTQARSTYEVMTLLAEDVEPPLEALHQRLAAMHERSLAGTAPSRAELAALQGELDTLGDERIRQLSHTLHPSIIQLGLLPALKSLARHYEPHFAVRLEADAQVSHADDVGQSQFPDALRLTAYRLVEAALDNVARHAEASRVTIDVVLAPSEGLTLRVADDGNGYAPATSSRGLGHELIESRVSLLGGQWGVESAPGAGTRVWARLPVPEAASGL